MVEISKKAKNVPGTFCWEDLYTNNLQESKTFYQSLFGWKVEDFQIGDKPTYSLFSINGKEICSICEFSDKEREQKVAPRWITSIAVANADDFVKIAKIAGGIIVETPKDHRDEGRSALIQDPSGGLFGIWEERKATSGPAAEGIGSACWRELITPNIDVAGKFYSTVCSWNPKAEKFGDMAYVTFKLGPKSVGGMIGAIQTESAAYWLTYWTVKNCEKSLKQCDDLGGKILKSPITIKHVGQFSVLSDPQGARFAIMQPEIK